MKLSKEKRTLLTYGAGAGLGVAVPILLKKYVDSATPYPNIWQKPSIYIPIVTGAGAIMLSFTKLVKNKDRKTGLLLYGITAGLAGILAAVTETSLAARANLGCSTCAQKTYQNLRNAGGHTNMPGTQSDIPSNLAPCFWSNAYYPNFEGSFLNCPQSRARGWAMDVTRNPKAALPSFNPNVRIIA